jgi:hypothetical protein
VRLSVWQRSSHSDVSIEKSRGFLNSLLMEFEHSTPLMVLVGNHSFGKQRRFRLTHPFEIFYLPLNYSGNPGVNDVSYRGANCKRSR